jgi:CO/xanthine dehydrogenase Mo-binding subunit
MGQGVYHGLTTLIAEELSTSPDLITVHHASVDKAFNNVEFGVQGTGGSNSMRTHYLPLRQAGANARMAILNAASDQLNAPITELTLQDGQVLHQNQRYPFGDFVGVASQHSPPTHSPLKPSADFLFIGKDRTRIDSHSKSNGSAQFGIDIELPNLMRAVLKRCPVRGGTVKSYDDKTAISMPGVKCIVQVNNGIAVVAESYWQARQASSKIVVEWDLPELAKFSSADFKHTLHTILENEDGKEAYIKGSGDTLLASSETVFTAEYWAPYLSHATMEPMNCTVRIENNQCDVWVGSQLPDVAKGIAALYSEIDIENVTIHSTFLGGGFGRRLSADYVAEATTIAKASGLPIQLIWSREDDMQNDFYRPASLVQFSASVDTNGLLNTFSVKRAGPNIQPYQIENSLPGLAPAFIP